MIMRRKSKKVRMSHEHCLLMLEIPRENDKKELAAEQMLAALHGILRSKRELRVSGTLQEHISLEIAAKAARIRFYIWTPKHLQAFVEGQIYAQYPTVQITEQETDYSERQLEQDVIHTAELTLTETETIPIKTFPSFEVDPLASITATLAKLDKQEEEMWIQIIARPIADDWHKRGSKMVARIRGGRGGLSGGGTATLNYAGQAFAALIRPPDASGKEGGSAPDVSERDKARITAIETKTQKLGYQVKIRLVYAGNDPRTARLRMQALVGAFKQFNTTNLNGFKVKNSSFRKDKQLEYQTRFFIDHGFILNIEELASLFHLPHTTVETPNIVWATTKTAEPPANIPVTEVGHEEDISLFGVTNFRGDNTVFGIRRDDRGRHMYILGQTGTGKSGALELLTISDIYYNKGFAVLDPHGDYAQHVLKFIPSSRINDVIYFNPADTDYPIGFNPLEISDPSLKGHISSQVVGVLKKLFADSWGPRLEYILRYTILALLDFPNSTMLDITRMLTDRHFRQDVIKYIDDPVVKNFWTVEFASWNDKFASEAVAPVLNKVGAFTANPMIRNIVGQPKSTFDIRKIMDEGKILIVNLSRGLMGEDNAGILGSLVVTKIQLAAMGRADVPEDKRTPFYLYVDEFQNFATESFATILSEARKYGLNLTVANQYISQMGEEVRGAVFGNVGTVMSFRVSPDDAPFLQKYFEPEFEAANLIQQHSRFFVISMMIDGEKAPGFSAKTLNLPQPPEDNSLQIIANTREHYSRSRAEVEIEIRDASGLPNTPSNNEGPRVAAQPKVTPREQIVKLATGLTHPDKQAGSAAPPDQSAKRKRSRRRGSGRGEQSQPQTPPTDEPSPSSSSDEHTIRLR
ncbi:MAG: type IV secretion system DNA-binding domain-containing protein [bacterium]|nr:type IV secretion system DNA-binding domain-containing protein [bacterium]